MRTLTDAERHRRAWMLAADDSQEISLADAAILAMVEDQTVRAWVTRRNQRPAALRVTGFPEESQPREGNGTGVSTKRWSLGEVRLWLRQTGRLLPDGRTGAPKGVGQVRGPRRGRKVSAAPGIRTPAGALGRALTAAGLVRGSDFIVRRSRRDDREFLALVLDEGVAVRVRDAADRVGRGTAVLGFPMVLGGEVGHQVAGRPTVRFRLELVPVAAA